MRTSNPRRSPTRDRPENSAAASPISLGAASEIPYNIASVNDQEGSEALAYGAFRGVSRALVRGGIGFYEMITAPFPTTKGKVHPEAAQ